MPGALRHAAQASLAAVLRAYVIRFPLKRGKGVLLRRVVARLPDDVRALEVPVQGGAVAVVRWDEVIGRSILRHGGYEEAEAAYVRARARPGTTALDVGANVGLLTLALATAVGPGGRVLALEPGPATVARLRANVARNALGQVGVLPVAAGAAEGETVLHLRDDPGLASTAAAGGTAVRVPVRTLDAIWREAGEPDVSVVKVDVEGGELEVLAGARSLLERCRPAVLAEARTRAAAEALAASLAPLGYAPVTPPGLSPRNRAFEAR